MKVRLPRRRLWRVVIYVVAIWLVVTAVDLVMVQMGRGYHVGYRTTRAVGPVLADGRVDFLLVADERFGRGVTAENNAAVPMLRAMGRQALSPAQPRDGVTQRLGMEPLAEGGEHFVLLDDFRKARGLGPEVDTATTAPANAEGEEGTWPPALGDLAASLGGKWPPRVDEVTREWVKVNGRALDVMVEGSRRERFFVPFFAGSRPETMISVYLKHLLPIRQACRALMTRAVVRLEAGDGAGFVSDMVAVHRWARLLGQAHTLVEVSVAEQIEAAACRLDRLGAGSGVLGAGEARALAKELAAMGEVESPVESVDSLERFAVLDVMQWAARGGPAKLAILMDVILRSPAAAPDGEARWHVKALTRFLPVRYEAAMENVNAYYDGAVVAWRQPTWALRREAMKQWVTEIERTSSRNLVNVFLTSNWPAVYLVPALQSSMRKEAETRAETRMARVALGLAAHKAERGDYPASLAELGTEVPLDPFTDLAFGYVRADGGYRLTSVGPDMKDDGGAKDDLIVRTAGAAGGAATRSAK